MRTPLLLSLAGLLAASCSGDGATSTAMSAQANSSNAAASAPTSAPLPAMAFIAAMGSTDTYERQAGQLATQRGRGEAVKRFGQMMVSDHTRTTADLTAAATKSGLTPPPPAMNAKHRSMLDQLTAAQGDFDAVYARQQVMAHQEALAIAQSYAAGGDDPNLRASRARPRRSSPSIWRWRSNFPPEPDRTFCYGCDAAVVASSQSRVYPPSRVRG